MTSKRKLIVKMKTVFLHSLPVYQSGMSKHAFAGHMAFVALPQVNSWD